MSAVDAPGLEPLLQSTVDRTADIDRRSGAAVLSRIWVRLGAAELLLLMPVPLLLLARLGIQPRIDAVAATALSVALPLALGMAALGVPARILRGRRHRWTLVDVGTAMALGLILTLGAAVAFDFIGRFDLRTMGLVFVGAGSAGWLLLRILDLTDRSVADHRVDTTRWPEIFGGLFVAGLGVALAAWYRVDSPVPYHPQWDAFAHLRIIDALFDGTWSPWTTDYSETFRVNAYFPVQQLLTAVASRLTKVDPLAIYWGGPFVMMPVVAMLAYAIARALKVRQVSAILVAGACLIAGLTFQATAFEGILPLALAYPFFSVVLLAVIGRGHWTATLATVVVLGAGALAGHWLLGGAVLAFGLGLVVLRWLDARIDGFWIIAFVAVGVVATIMFLGYSEIRLLPARPVGIATGDERFFGRIVSLASRQLDFQTRLSPVLAFGSAAGAFLLAWRARPGARRTVLALAWAGCLAALALPIAGADRGFAILPTILAPTLAVAIDRVFDVALRPGRSLGERGLGVGIAMAVVVALAIQPAFWLSGYQHARAASTPFFSSFSPTELAAGEAVRHRTPQASFVVSDPLTQEILGGVGDRESYGGGPYGTDEQLTKFRDAVLAPDAAGAWTALTAIGRDAGAQGPLLVALTGRTGDWLAHPIGYWPGYYVPLSKYTKAPRSQVSGVLRTLSDERYFQPFWQNDDVVVVAVRPAPGVKVQGIGGPWIGRATGAPPASGATSD